MWDGWFRDVGGGIGGYYIISKWNHHNPDYGNGGDTVRAAETLLSLSLSLSLLCSSSNNAVDVINTAIYVDPLP